MFRKINEVLFRNERMCATRFSTSGVAFLRLTELRDVELARFYDRKTFWLFLTAILGDIKPRVKNMKLPRLDKPRVDFPVLVQSNLIKTSPQHAPDFVLSRPRQNKIGSVLRAEIFHSIIKN